MADNTDIGRWMTPSLRSKLLSFKRRAMRKVLPAGWLAICLGSGLSALPFALAQAEPSRALRYDYLTRSKTPIPASERALQTVVADTWHHVSAKGLVLEGAIFDRAGNLLFCDVSERRVLRLSPEHELSEVVRLEGLAPGGLALHPDGRLFIAAIDLSKGHGAIYSVNADGSALKTVIPALAGYMPNDLVFDRKGGFYFTDFKGTATEPSGGVYYVAPDLTSIKAVLPHLALANGVALSPDGRTLWATEFGRNLLHRVELRDATTATPIGSAVAYHFTGPAPDSMRMDVDGNVYVAIYGQGRILAFNPIGIPIGQVLLPGRDEGHNLASTSLAIDPHSNNLFAVASDMDQGQGATIFHAGAFSRGLPPSNPK